ncbi:MAG TPA: HAMP domain-containing sensor histidine kinase, partial [Clostridia bacterium]|nr:HAMP domain-containing sensor histidine kinase [Clostridia bacterium]
IARRSTEDFSQAAKEKNIDLAVEGDGDCEILCDPKWLQEAIGNMIKNCLEYTSPGGKVTVGTEQTPVMVTIRVSDTGTGIHPDDLPYVFRRFYRGRASSGPGSGIGLSLAKSIVEQMGGTLTAGGEYGRGAVFTLSFLKDVM